jgi:hypothetical protein
LDPLRISASLDQGCPLSPICYIIYNSPALETIPEDRKNLQAASSFINDQVFLAKRHTFEEASAALKNTMEKTGRFLEWAHTHNCEVELPKCMLMGFSHRQIPDLV